MYTTRAVIESLRIPERTLRHWSTAFEAHLSPGARPRRGPRGSSHRRYNDADLAILQRVKNLAASGLRLAEIDAILRGARGATTLEALRRAPGSEGHVTPSDVVAQLAAATREHQRNLQALDQRVTARFEALMARIQALETRVRALEGEAEAASDATPVAPETSLAADPANVAAPSPAPAPARRPTRKRFALFPTRVRGPRQQENFRRNMIRLMARRGWTSEDLAQAAGLSQERIAAIVKREGDATISVSEEEAAMIAAALETDIKRLFSGG